MIFRYLAAGFIFVMVLVSSAIAGSDGGFKFYNTKGDFAGVSADVEDAIINRGYVVDYHGFIGKMLKRTAQDVGDAKKVYKDAEFYQFCSAVLSRRMVEADPKNIGFCPYVVVVYELESAPGTIQVGYRNPPMTGSDESQKALGAIAKLLDEISREATK